MNKAVRHLGTMLLLCAPLVTMAQDADKYRANREQATQIGGRVERTIKAREPKWKLKDSFDVETSFHQDWKSGSKEMRVSIYVYDSPEEASKMLLKHARSSSATGEEELGGFGDEAFYLSHRYFSWVLVRKGRVLTVVEGPPDLNVTKRFAQYGLAQIQGK